jgi:hypothetical protein
VVCGRAKGKLLPLTKPPCMSSYDVSPIQQQSVQRVDQEHSKCLGVRHTLASVKSRPSGLWQLDLHGSSTTRMWKEDPLSSKVCCVCVPSQATHPSHGASLIEKRRLPATGCVVYAWFARIEQGLQPSALDKCVIPTPGKSWSVALQREHL